MILRTLPDIVSSCSPVIFRLRKTTNSSILLTAWVRFSKLVRYRYDVLLVRPVLVQKAQLSGDKWFHVMWWSVDVNIAYCNLSFELSVTGSLLPGPLYKEPLPRNSSVICYGHRVLPFLLSAHCAASPTDVCPEQVCDVYWGTLCCLFIVSSTVVSFTGC